MDAVYILGSGSLAQNEEIRYSLRSLSQYLLDLRNVYVIGDDPGFLPGVFHIPMEDKTEKKWKNAYFKIQKACRLDDLSDDFLLMNDDFFLIEPVLGEDFPFYALKDSNGGNCGPVSFQIHCPMRINKEFYLKLPLTGSEKGHWSPRTMYANFYKAPPAYCDDFILRAGKGCRDFDQQIKKWPCFSVGDSAMLYSPFVEWLRGRYPSPSKFEV